MERQAALLHALDDGVFPRAGWARDDDQQGLWVMEVEIWVGRHIFILLETFHED